VTRHNGMNKIEDQMKLTQTMMIEIPGNKATRNWNNPFACSQQQMFYITGHNAERFRSNTLLYLAKSDIKELIKF